MRILKRNFIIYGGFPQFRVEAFVAERLTTRTLDLKVWGPSLARPVVSLDKELYSTLSLFTQVYNWVPAINCWEGGGGGG